MTENKSNTTQEPILTNLQVNEQEINLMEILHKIIGIRKTIYKAAGIGLLLGIIVGFSVPKKYTVNVTLSPEMGNSKGGNGLAGLAASFLGSGATMTEGMDALNASLSSDIVSSTPFLLDLLQMNVVQKDIKENITLESYLDEESSPWWSYIIGFPSVLISGVKSLFTDEPVVTNNTQNGTIELTKEVAQKIELLKKMIIASIDKKTGITSVSVTLQQPKVAAIVADSVVHKLQESIIGYRTTKAKEDCAYLEKLFEERQREYYAAQKKYASYVDSHDNLILQSVRTEQERLQNDMSLAYQVYSQVATQLQVARAKVQEEKPVFAVVEPAVVPLQASSVGLKAYAFVFMILCSIIAISWKLKGQEIWKTLRDNKK